MTIDYEDQSRPRLLRGPLLRAALTFLLLTAGVVSVSAWLILPPAPRPAAAWDPVIVIAIVGVAGSLLVIAATALVTIRVEAGCLQYKFGPILIKWIPLKDITHYEYRQIGRMVQTRVRYGPQGVFSPGGVIDHKQLAAFLDAHGVPRTSL